VAFRLDPHNRLSYALQVQRQALAHLIAGRLRPGDRFPSVRQLARDLGISRTTGARIQNELCDATLAEVRPRSGVFVTSPDDAIQRQRLFHVRAVSELLKETVFRARELGIDGARLAQLIRAFDRQSREAAGLACFPVIATRDWYECMIACLEEGFPARLVHLDPCAKPAEFPPQAQYLLSGYFLRGRARAMAAAIGRPLLYVRYNVAVLDRAMTFPAGEFRYFVTRDADNARTTHQFLASAYPEVPTKRYEVMTAAEFLEVVSVEPKLRGTVWATITAAPLLVSHVPHNRLQILHPLLAEDFVEEIRCLALFRSSGF
jgi:GntR family transcriptional regulator